MAIKAFPFAVLLLVAISTIFSTCKKNFGCANSTYSFEAGIRIYPDKDSINIGDTLWMEMNEPTTFLDLGSGLNVNYDNAENLGTTLRLIELLENSKFQGAYKKFKLKLEFGQNVQNLTDTSSLKEYLFIERNNKYIFRLGFVPNQKGIFRISFGNAQNVYRKNDKCTKAGFVLKLKQTNSHAYFNNTNFPGIITDSTKLYCFKVK